MSLTKPLAMSAFKIKHPVLWCCAFAIIFGAVQKGNAQNVPDSANVKRQVSKISSVYAELQQEQVYLHFDKPNYAGKVEKANTPEKIVLVSVFVSDNLARYKAEAILEDGAAEKILVVHPFEESKVSRDK